MNNDPSYIISCIETIVGLPEKPEPSSSGYLSYKCPFSSCYTNSYNFGICVVSGSRSPLGFWICIKCGNKGFGYFGLCRALGIDPMALQTYSDKPRVIIKSDENLTPEEFYEIWSWVRKNSSGLSDLQKESLLARGIEWDLLPLWYNFPSKEILLKVVDFFGESACRKASILSPHSNTIDRFSREDRLALRYPELPWKTRIEYLSSYKSGDEKRILRPRSSGISSTGIIYYRGNSISNYPLVITEGEIKAEASFQAGIPTIGLLGIGNSHQEVAEAILYLLINSNYQYPGIICIIFDTDINPKVIGIVNEAKQRLIKRITRVLGPNCPQIIIRNLSLYREGEKADIDGWLSYLMSVEKYDLESAREIYRNFVIYGNDYDLYS